MPIVADAAVAIRGDLSHFNRDLKGAGRGVQGLGQQMKSAFSPQNLAVGGAVAGIGLLTAGIGDAVGALINMERLSAQTDAAIRSTGGAAKVSRDEIVALAEGMEELTGTEMETVQEGANLLLTFTQIRNEVGKGNDIFNRATESALDLSVALGIDMRSASMMLGKALNDPVTGITALRRAGVQLTDQQKEQIKVFVESGDVLSAQKVILEELEVQVGESAEAFGNTTAGKMQKFTNAVGNFFEGIVTGLVDAGTTFDRMGKIDAFEKLKDQMDGGLLGMQDWNTEVHRIADTTGRDFETLSNRIAASMAINGKSFEDAAAEAEEHFAALPVGMKVAGLNAAHAVRDGLVAGGPVVAQEAGKIAGMLPAEIAARVEDVKQVGRDSVLALATAILEKQRDPLLAIDALNAVIAESMSDAELISKLSGEATMESLRTGLGSSLEADRVATQEALQPILDTLNSLGPAGKAAGAAMMHELGLGIEENVPVRKARDAAGMIVDVFPTSEPKDPLSPFRGITHWNPLRPMYDNIANSGADFAAATRQALAGAIPGVPIPLAGVGSGAGGGSISNTYNVDARDRIKGHSIEDIGYGLKRLGEMGVLPGTNR